MAANKRYIPRKRKTNKKKKQTTRVVKVSDPTVEKLQIHKMRVYKCSKALQVNRPYATTTAGTCGFQIAWQGTAFAAGYNLLFDPAGVFGNNSGTAQASGSTLAYPAQVPDWQNLKALYSLYRVDKITLDFGLTTVGNQNTMPMVLYMRYLGEYNAPTPTLNLIAGENNWIKKTFTDENPTFKYSFVPKVATLGDNAASLATDSRSLKRMDWTSTQTPIELYGFKIYFDFPLVASPDIQFISCDITYHMSFKENI